jgi:hypothetical protein
LPVGHACANKYNDFRLMASLLNYKSIKALLAMVMRHQQLNGQRA